MPDLDWFITNWQRNHKQTIKLMQVAPDDKYDWKTCESAMTLGGLMNHFRQGEVIIAHAAVSGVLPQERLAPINNTAELIAAFNQSHEEAIAQAATLTPEQLAEQVSPFGAPMTRAQLLQAQIEHEVHHRGQLYTYLRILGVEVPPLFG
jgi:uncharacterized damage-inducible protein DinB